MQTISIRCTETAYRSLYESTRNRQNECYTGDNTRFDDFDFSFSAKNGTSSAGMSIGYAKELARILSFGFFQIHSNADLMMHAEAVHTFVRKTAHFTEYAVLGFFTYKAVSCDVKDRKKAVLMAQLISTGYASTDEIHQMFVPGREGKVFDVLIDSCGAFCGIMVSLITQKFIEKRKEIRFKMSDFLSFHAH